MDEQGVYKGLDGINVSLLVLCVDDILVIGNDVGTLASIKF